jgi:prolyl oligopeptidase
MSQLIEPPPPSAIEPVTEVLHGVPITDPYRWLEDPNSSRTRHWIRSQTRYARSYLTAIPGRTRIRERLRQLLDIEKADTIQKTGNRYFYRKRFRGQEQACICFRESLDGPDHVLLDPETFGLGPNAAIRLLRVSPDGHLLLYERKEGGEQTGIFHLFDVDARVTLPDTLPRGYLRGFAFTEDSKGFYYVHQSAYEMPNRHAALHHVLGMNPGDDREIFSVSEKEHVRLHIVPGVRRMGFLVYRCIDPMRTDFFLWEPKAASAPFALVRDADYRFAPYLLGDGRILALTNHHAPNFKIVEIHFAPGEEPEFRDLVPMRDQRIQGCVVTDDKILVAYLVDRATQVDIYDSEGKRAGQLPSASGETIRLSGCSPDGREVFFERESFTRPIRSCVYLPAQRKTKNWAEPEPPIISADLGQEQVTFEAGDGTRIPMFLVGRRDVLVGGPHPTVMTSYGGYGVAMTPRFSVLAVSLIERGCLFALPNIRGGSEFGEAWHSAAVRRNRRVAFDDFLSAAEWLVKTRRTEPEKLAIFGASNAGLLVGVAMTERPDLFRAAVCMVPVLDMLRYHLFDSARDWTEEFGTSDDPDDFDALRRYSPYHRVRDGVAYPATMLVSGERDQICNPLHVRKMTARLQAASVSNRPILLDYSNYRGHSPVLPFCTRWEALTDRLAFLCDQLGLSA